MAFWETLWLCVLIAGVAVFACLAVVVAVGGFFDIRALLRGIESRDAAEKDRGPRDG